jgi:PilZ domain-containing protein
LDPSAISNPQIRLRGAEPEGRDFITPKIEKRQHRRAKLVTQIRCEALGREELHVTRDISVGGLFVSSNEPFPQDSEVSVFFHLRPSDPAISCQGKVVYSLKGLGMGVQFTDLSDADRLSLQKFVDESN